MRAVLAGFEQYLVKPVEPAELVTMVAVLTRGKRRASS
jgi:DNA-binding response OmpR family regulator